MKEMAGALAPPIYEENQGFMRASTGLAAEFGFARRLCSEPRQQIIDNSKLRRDAVSAID